MVIMVRPHFQLLKKDILGRHDAPVRRVEYFLSVGLILLLFFTMSVTRRMSRQQKQLTIFYHSKMILCVRVATLLFSSFQILVMNL